MARLTGGVAAVQVRASAVVVQDGENLHGSFMGADGVRDHGGELRYFPAVDEDAPLPDASITALDRSADMLAATVKAAANHGFADRVGTLKADLGAPWPASATADLMRASSSLHEVHDPERTMAGMFAALNPVCLLVVMEMDGLPSFLPTDGTGNGAAERSLESRLHAAMTRLGWNAHPDWRWKGRGSRWWNNAHSTPWDAQCLNQLHATPQTPLDACARRSQGLTLPMGFQHRIFQPETLTHWTRCSPAWDPTCCCTGPTCSFAVAAPPGQLSRRSGLWALYPLLLLLQCRMCRWCLRPLCWAEA